MERLSLKLGPGSEAALAALERFGEPSGVLTELAAFARCQGRNIAALQASVLQTSIKELESIAKPYLTSSQCTCAEMGSVSLFNLPACLSHAGTGRSKDLWGSTWTASPTIVPPPLHSCASGVPL